jgi:hypothetical protein
MRETRRFSLPAGREQVELTDRIARSASPKGLLPFPGWDFLNIYSWLPEAGKSDAG